SMIHLLEVAMVLTFVPDRTVQITSPCLAASSDPRSTMATFSFSRLTVQVGPANGARPNSLPAHQAPPAKTTSASRPRPKSVQSLRSLLQGRALGRREEPGPRELRLPFADGLPNACASERAKGDGGVPSWSWASWSGWPLRDCDGLGESGVCGFIDPDSSQIQRQLFQVLVELHTRGEIAEPDIKHSGLGVVQVAEGAQVLLGKRRSSGLAGSSRGLELVGVDRSYNDFQGAFDLGVQ